MVYCATFKDITPQMAGEIGVKALNIAELFTQRYPVPKGFVIKSRALSDFLLKNKFVESINTILENVDINNHTSLTDASRKITDMILAGSIPDSLANEISATYKNFSVSDDMKGLNDTAKSMINAGRGDPYVAVRSSAIIDKTNACASGLHATILNTVGTPALMNSILKCFASFYSAPAIYYYKKNNIRSPELAIIVQEMITSEKSGVLFTANPLTNNLSEFIIEGSFGLGECIATGEVAPDRYVLNLRESAITEAKVNRKASTIIIDQLNGGTKKERVATAQSGASTLSTGEIKVLAEIADKIQAHFNHPQDIEWAISKQRVYILQSVPITTLSTNQDTPQTPQQCENAICTGTGANTGTAEGEIRIINSPFEASTINQGSILVAPSASLDLLPALNHANGIITNNGGMLCNLAKISREMNIPMIVGTNDATTKLTNGTNVTMDCASANICIKNNTPTESIEEEKDIPVTESDSDEEPIIATKIKLNITGESDYENIKDTTDGIGCMSLDAKPIYDTQAQQDMASSAPNLSGNFALKTIDAFYPKSVWIKTKDLHDPDFKNQLTELKLVIDKGYNNLGIMFPAIHHQAYISKIKKISEEIGLNLSSIEFGISIDTPAACILCEDFSGTGIKFISIDYEKLIRNTLGLNPDTRITNHDMHPAVLKIIENCIRNYHKRKIHTSIHGKAITNQHFVEKMIQFHIDSISVNKEEFRMLKYVAARTEKKMLLDIMIQRRHNTDNY